MPPTMLIDALNSVRRQIKLLGVLFGAGIVLAWAVLLLLVTIGLDYILNLPAVPRVIVIVSCVAWLGYSLFHYIVRPILARLTLSDVAGRLEHAFPQFDDRLRSTVDFASPAQHIPGSDAMKDRVVTEATAMARQLDLSSAIVKRPVYLANASAFGAIALVIVLWLAVGPSIRSIIASRLLTPFNAKPWPRSVQIDLVGNVPLRVPVGQRVDLHMRLIKGDKASMKPLVYYQYGDGPVEREYMSRAPDGAYSASLDARLESGAQSGQLKAWMKAGDDEKFLTPIVVVPRLGITDVQAVLAAPKYAELPPVTADLRTAPAVTVFGAQIELKVTFNKPLAPTQQITIEPVGPEGKLPQAAWTLPNPSTASGRWIAGESLRFHVRATDTDGFQNSALEEYELIVKPDQNPSVQIENPKRNEERTPEAVVPLQGVAEDDYGIQSLKLEVDRLKDKKHWEVALVDNGKPVNGAAWSRIDSSGDRLRYRINYPWELKSLAGADLKPGDVLEYFLLVQDNFDLNGSHHSPIPSGHLRIAIISQEDFANRISEELRTIAQQVGQIKAGQLRTRQETSVLKADTESKPQFDNADRAVSERLGNQQSTAASQSKQVASKLDNIKDRMDENRSPNADLKQTAVDVRDVLNDTAENPMKQAVNQINASRDPKQQSPETRNPNLDQAVANQDKAAENLQRALDRMGNIGSLSRAIDMIKALLDQQQKISKETADIGKDNLGKKPEEMNDADRKRLNDNATQQQKLAEKTDKAMEELKKLGDSMAKTDPPTAEAMKQGAQTGQQQQVSQKQREASGSASKNQQASAQSAQKQAELGLSMILNDLREAERRKLEELARKLEEMQQQIANLIRRQAGHNLDNIGIQNQTTPMKLDGKIWDDLMTKAERNVANPPPVPSLGQLDTAQEQTERNTRDIARAAEELPAGAESGALLIKAAGKMERAAVFLRDKKLPEAYDPPQVEALVALDQAKKIIDEQKKAVDDKLAQQQREAIKLAYIHIKEDQEKLNTETKRIDGTPHAEDGNLPRIEAVRLGQLPGEQGKLADRTNDLEERLSALGGVVYVWANKDIASSMGQVKTDLAKPTTGIPTQAEETRIVEQLDAMIKSLTVHPIQKKFDQRGGGGGQCKPGLPSEAELRLLKELQAAINKSTKTIDSQPNKDKPKLVSLGNRQGSLRELLGKMFEKASNGQFKLGPEPDNRDALPEEAGKEQVENQELEKELLTDDQATEKAGQDISLVGDRMARSRQRLAINTDPGKVTQIIQDKIQQNLDELIEMARVQQAKRTPGQQQKNTQQKNGPKPGEPNPSNQASKNSQSKPNHAVTPAGQSSAPGSADATADVSQDIQEKMTEWGGVTKRQRQAVLDNAGETPIEKYKGLIDDYYRSLATKETERK